MLCLIFEFPGGRYHATPWGHHVNEGLVEWPPSPWRIVRALLATGYTKLGWKGVPPEMRTVVEALATCLPTYRLPQATLGHTRHFMPIKGWKRGLQQTSLVIDAFIYVHGPLGVCWPVEMPAEGRRLVGELVEKLGYLGRAESRVKARLELPERLPVGADVATVRRNGDDESVRLLAPVPSPEYEAWRRDRGSAANVPEDLLAALQLDTASLQREGWSIPPGSREAVYWRPAGAVAPAVVRTVAPAREISRANTALFALATDHKRDVLPLMERALPTMALFRRALVNKLGEKKCPELSGKDDEGRPLRGKHSHAYFIPLSLEPRNRGRIDHVLVHAPMGFGPIAQRALRGLRKTWAKRVDNIAVTLVGLGDLASFRRVGGVALPELGTGRVWQSRTPFIPPRFLKARGKDSLEGQVRAELNRRGYPDLTAPPVPTRPTGHGRAAVEARWFRHFVRTRQGSAALVPPPGLFHLTLVFERPVTGPICLGWGSHFGLGLFVPEDRSGGEQKGTVEPLCALDE